MTSEKDDMTRLEACFDAARRGAPEPSGDLMARILADAEAEAQYARPKAAPRMRLWQQFVDGIGGWPAMGGLATATVAGLWLGINPPALLQDATGALLEVEAASYWVDTSAELALGLGEGDL